MPYVERAGARVYFETEGQGPTVLLTHGFACSGRLWERQLQALSDGYQLISWDARGHDRSDSPAAPDDYSREYAVSDMAAILDACGARTAFLVGHSMGCVLSVSFYLAHRDRVSGLFLVGGGAGPAFKSDPERDAWNANVAKVAHDLIENGLAPAPAEIGQLTAGGILAAPECRLAQHRSAEGLAKAVRGMLVFRDTAAVDALATVAAPTYAVVGENERHFAAAADNLVRTIPGARKIVIPDAGHTPCLEQPDRFNAELRRALDEALASA